MRDIAGANAFTPRVRYLPFVIIGDRDNREHAAATSDTARMSGRAGDGTLDVAVFVVVPSTNERYGRTSLLNDRLSVSPWIIVRSGVQEGYGGSSLSLCLRSARRRVASGRHRCRPSPLRRRSRSPPLIVLNGVISPPLVITTRLLLSNDKGVSLLTRLSRLPAKQASLFWTALSTDTVTSSRLKHPFLTHTCVCTLRVRFVVNVIGSTGRYKVSAIVVTVSLNIYLLLNMRDDMS